MEVVEGEGVAVDPGAIEGIGPTNAISQPKRHSRVTERENFTGKKEEKGLWIRRRRREAGGDTRADDGGPGRGRSGGQLG